MQQNFQKALARVLQYEGGKVNDPHDPGGKTNQGITQRTYSAWLRSQGKPTADVFTMPDADRDAIYKSEYWDMVSGDQLPAGLDLVVFDASVNSGAAQAVKWLQSSLGSAYTGAIDGILGAKTLDALTASSATTDDALIEGVCSRRLAMLKRLTTWKYFGTGWSARIANVQKTALAWADAGPEPLMVDLSSVGGQAKAQLSDLKPPVVSQITAHMATAATGTGTVAAQAATQVQSLQDTFSWVKYVFGGLTLLSVGAGIVALLATQLNTAVTSGTATAEVDLEADTKLAGAAK